jgi:hypothetical protein
MRIQTGAALLLVALMHATSANDPECAPPGDEICKVMRTEEFRSAFRRADPRTVNAGDVPRRVRSALHRVVVGAAHAGPAAVGKQIDDALDAALGEVQRICGNARARPAVARSVAEALAGAGRSLGTDLAPGDLGRMTGWLVALLDARGVECICAAANFDDITQTCSPRRSP